MDDGDIPDEILRLDVFLAGHATRPTRRELLQLFAALPLALSGTVAGASQINPSETQITLPGAIRWSGWINGFPPHSGEMATLYGGLDKPGPYLVLMDEVVPGLHERSAYLRHRSPLARTLRNVVG
jgi:hypothetical protein